MFFLQIVLSIGSTLVVQDIWAAAKYQSNIEHFTTRGEGAKGSILKARINTNDLRLLVNEDSRRCVSE